MKAIILLALLMSGCSVFDAPNFKPDRNNLDMQIKVVLVSDFSELAKRHGFESLGGMTTYNNSNRCTLYIPKLEGSRDSYTMCVAGHEFFHCMLGDYHERDGVNPCRVQQAMKTW